MMKKITFLIVLITISINSFSQICIDKSAPDSSAVLDLSVSNKGLLMPTMNTLERENMQTNPPSTGLADGLLVFDTDYKRFYFWDTSSSTWVAINNWCKNYTYSSADDEDVYIELENNSNLGINEEQPKSKLTVNGNLSVGANNIAPTNGAYIEGNVKVGNTTNLEKLEVEDNLRTNGTYTARNLVGRGTSPIGAIVAYKGSISNFDGNGEGLPNTPMEDWSICNGYANKTPNLDDRFIIGADPTYTSSSTGKYQVDSIGGQTKVKLTINQMPSHTHPGTTITAGSHHHSIGFRGIKRAAAFGNTRSVMEPSGSSTSTGEENYHKHSFSIGTSGSSSYHENRPPYYALYYIMRIK